MRLHGALSGWVLERETGATDQKSSLLATSKWHQWQGQGHALERLHFFHCVRALAQQEFRLGGPQTREHLSELDADRVGLRRALCWGLISAREREVESAFEALLHGYAFYSVLEGGPETLGQTLPLLLDTGREDPVQVVLTGVSLPSGARPSLERMRLRLGLGLAGLGLDSSTPARKLTRFATERLLRGARRDAAVAWGQEALLELAASLAARPAPKLEGSRPQRSVVLSQWLETLPPVVLDPRHRAWTHYYSQLAGSWSTPPG